MCLSFALKSTSREQLSLQHWRSVCRSPISIGTLWRFASGLYPWSIVRFGSQASRPDIRTWRWAGRLVYEGCRRIRCSRPKNRYYALFAFCGTCLFYLRLQAAWAKTTALDWRALCLALAYSSQFPCKYHPRCYQLHYLRFPPLIESQRSFSFGPSPSCVLRWRVLPFDPCVLIYLQFWEGKLGVTLPFL